MRADYRVTPWMAVVVVGAVMLASGAAAAWLIRDAVAWHTADAQPATITDIDRPGTRTGNNRPERVLSFRTEDGTNGSDEVQDRWFWWPSPGDTIHVFEQHPGDWEVEEEFSWVRTVGYLLLALVPWLFGLLKLWDWAEQRYRPERWAEKRRRDRERRRTAVAAREAGASTRRRRGRGSDQPAD